MKTASLKITPELLRLIAAVDEFKGSWRAFSTLAPERLAALKGQKDRLSAKVARAPRTEGLHPDAVKILDETNRAGRITTGEAEKLTGAPRPTVKLRLTELLRRGLLVRQGRGRGAWYELPRPS